MYTERERVRFVERMWAEGLTPASAHRAWGRPSRSKLSQWARDAKEGRLPAERPRVYGACTHESHAHYPETTVKEALRLVGLGRKRGEVARQLGISDPSVIDSWRAKQRRRATLPPTGGGPTAPASGGGKPMSNKKTSAGMQPGDELPKDPAARAKALELENAYLRAVLDVLKGGVPDGLTNEEKTRVGEQMRKGGLSLRALTATLRISKSSYEYQRARLVAGDSLATVRQALLKEFGQRPWQGYRRLWARLREMGIVVSEKVVRRIMREEGLVARCARFSKARPWSSYAGEISDAPDNLTLGERGKHEFKADAPGRLWVTDVTQFTIPAGKVWLSAVIDCFDGAPVGWAVSESPDAEMANCSLRRALATLGGPAATTELGLVIHSDRGCHYRLDEWVALCRKAGITRSMSRKAHSPDNARAEGFFGLLKGEFFHGLDWSGVSLGEFQARLRDYLVGFVTTRLKAFGGSTAACYRTIEGRRAELGLPSTLAA